MIDVALLGGGPSTEADVSLRSARAVGSVLRADRYRVTPIRVEGDGRWVASGIGDLTVFDRQTDRDPVPERRSRPVAAGLALAEWIDRARSSPDHDALVVFPALHGAYGEDGTVQGLLKAHDVPFVGSGVAASALCLDKVSSRQFLASLGFRVADAVTGFPPHDVAALAREAVDRVGLPAFAKLHCSGSSLGVARVETVEQLEQFLGQAQDHRVLIEALVEGLEVSVAVLGNQGQSCRALTPIGIRPIGRVFFDHVAKYDAASCEELVPPPGLDDELIAELQQLALRAHRVLGCDGVSRTDFIVTASGPVLLETNTMPGMTKESLLPKCAAHDGIAFGPLLSLLIDHALRRHGIELPTEAGRGS